MALKMMELSDEVVSPHGEPIKVIYFIVFYLVKVSIFVCLIAFWDFVSKKFHIIALTQTIWGIKWLWLEKLTFLVLWMRVLWSSKDEIEIWKSTQKTNAVKSIGAIWHAAVFVSVAINLSVSWNILFSKEMTNPLSKLDFQVFWRRSYEYECPKTFRL